MIGIDDDRSVAGYCPVCGGSLFLGDGGHVTCRRVDCPRPTAVDELLEDRETEHVVVFGDTGFTVRHPLRERLDDELMTCKLHEHIAGLSGPPVRPGRYRARPAFTAPVGGEPTWSWQAIRDGSKP